MKQVRISDAATGDVERAAAWYEARRDGLGKEFAARVLEAIDKVSANRLGYVKSIADARGGGIGPTSIDLWFKVSFEGRFLFEAPDGEMYDSLYLFAVDAGEPFHDVVDVRAGFEIFEDGGDGHASAFQYPGSAYFAGNAFDRGTLRPF